MSEEPPDFAKNFKSFSYSSYRFDLSYHYKDKNGKYKHINANYLNGKFGWLRKIIFKIRVFIIKNLNHE